MESCKGEKLSVYQQSFMIDDLLTRKGIEQNGEVRAAAKRRESSDNGTATATADVVSMRLTFCI